MSQDNSKRFTDREVALILRTAAELDESTGSGAHTGLSRKDLKEIAAEVGISVDSITRAMEQVGTDRPAGVSFAMAPLSHRAVHAVAGEFDQEALRRLVRVIDDEARTPGMVSDALGAIRWNASNRFYSTQVAITPGAQETTIQVTEKATGRLARVTHLMPGAFGMMFASVIGGVVSLAPGAMLGMLGLGLVGGGIAGRALWNRVSQNSRTRVGKLADALTREAREVAAERQALSGARQPD